MLTKSGFALKLPNHSSDLWLYLNDRSNNESILRPRHHPDIVLTPPSWLCFISADSVNLSWIRSLWQSVHSANNICFHWSFVWVDKLAAAELGPAKWFYIPAADGTAVEAAASWPTVMFVYCVNTGVGYIWSSINLLLTCFGNSSDWIFQDKLF